MVAVYVAFVRGNSGDVLARSIFCNGIGKGARSRTENPALPSRLLPLLGYLCVGALRLLRTASSHTRSVLSNLNAVQLRRPACEEGPL